MFTNENIKKIIQAFIELHERLRDCNLDGIFDFICSTLGGIYPRIRFYVADYRNEIYYGFKSFGMDKNFRQKFDYAGGNPFTEKKYGIKFDEVPKDLKSYIEGSEKNYILKKETLQEWCKRNVCPKYVEELGFLSNKISQSFTIHIPDPINTDITVGAISLDYGKPDREFATEKTKVLEALIGTYLGGIIAPLIREELNKAYGVVDQEPTAMIEEVEHDKPFYENQPYEWDIGIFRVKDPERESIIIYNSKLNAPLLKEAFETIDKLKNLQKPVVLIQGEIGTGKELIAKAIHYNSDRKNNPFITTNIAGYNESAGISASQKLFGYKDLNSNNYFPGVFELADKGTVFLDEIGEATKDVQGKLLRVIEYGDIEPDGVGGKKIKVDVAIVAATNEDFVSLDKNGRFTSAFYSRLEGHIIKLPPLRERKKDILPLIVYFAEKTIKTKLRFNKPTLLKIDPIALAKFHIYDWPRNIRELGREIEGIITDKSYKRDSYINCDDLSTKLKTITLNSEWNIFGHSPLQIYPWNWGMPVVKIGSDIEQIYKEFSKIVDNERIFTILSEKLSFVIAKNFFEGVDGKGEFEEKVRNALNKHGNKVKLWKNLIMKDCCDGCEDWRQDFSAKKDCQAKYVNDKVKKEDSCKRIQQNGEPYKTFYDWLPKCKDDNDKTLKSEKEKSTKDINKKDDEIRGILQKAYNEDQIEDIMREREFDSKVLINQYKSILNKGFEARRAARDAFEMAKEAYQRQKSGTKNALDK